jgi:citrate synthase
MNDDYYKKALDAARSELQELLRQKDETEKRIARLRQTVASLSALYEESENTEDTDDKVRIPGTMDAIARQVATATQAMYGRTIGFSDALREVLKANGGYMTPLEVRDGLIRMGIDLHSKYANPVAVIHTTLKRLEENKEIQVSFTESGKTGYRWRTSATLPPLPVPSTMKNLAGKEVNKGGLSNTQIPVPPPAPNLFRRSALKNLAGQEVKKGGLKELAEENLKKKE